MIKQINDKTIYLLGLSLLTFACISKTKNMPPVYEKPKDTLVAKDPLAEADVKPPILDSIYKTVCGIGLGKDSMVVEHTFLNDSISENVPQFSEPICLQQRLLFYQNGLLCKTRIFKVPKVIEKSIKSGIVKMDWNKISEIGIIHGKKGALYVIYGSSDCMRCNESFSFYSEKGDLLYFSYYTYENKRLKEFGDRNSVLKEYGIERQYETGDYKRMDVTNGCKVTR